jgi:hypothetical protein
MPRPTIPGCMPPPPMNLQVFKGTISTFERKKILVPGEYFFADAAEVRRDQDIQKTFAVLLAAAGDSGGASSALHRSGAEMSVEQVAFLVDGQKFSGQLEAFPFAMGDAVEVVADAGDSTGGGHRAYAVARPADRLVAVQPMCTRGRSAYFARAGRRCAGVAIAAALATGVFFLSMDDLAQAQQIGWGLGVLVGTALVWGFIEWRAYLENYKPLVHLAERIMALLGAADPRGVDLVRISRQTRTDHDPAGYRWTFYRY